MKKYPHGLNLRAVCAAIEAFEAQQDDVPESGMIAAFEVLLTASGIVQRAEAAEVEKAGAEERCRMMFDAKNHWADRAREAEGKLAELEKQGRILFNIKLPSDAPDLINLSPDQQTEFNRGFWYGVEKVKKLNPPAPAVSLADLVPDGWKLVPVEPTTEMLEEIWLDERFKELVIKRRYQALLAAAPEQE